MPRWLSEDPTIVYFILGLAALVLGMTLWVRQQRKYLIGLGIVALLIFCVWLTDHLVVTDGEQVVANLEKMASAVKAQNTDGIFEHIADEFTWQGMDKTAFRAYVGRAMGQGGVNDLALWDFEQTSIDKAAVFEKQYRMKFDAKFGNADMLHIYFKAKPKGSWTGDAAFYFCRSWFARGPDGHWRLVTFIIYNPAAESDKPMDIPALR